MTPHLNRLLETVQMRGHNIWLEGVCDDIFSYFSLKPYVVTPHLNCLVETVQMRGHNLCFYAELKKKNIVPNYH